MATDESLVLDLKLSLDNVNRQLDELKTQLDKKGNDLGSGFANSFGSSFSKIAGIASVAAGAIGAIASAKLFKDAVQAASEQEQAVTKLNASLAMSGQLTEAASRSLQEFASARQAVTAFGDEVTIQSMSIIQSIARLDQEGLKRATVASQDLATALGVDLSTASMMVAKAAEGNISSFQRLGLEIKKGATDAETFSNALKIIEERFGGRAQSDVQNYAGAISRLKNNFGDILEIIGDYIIKSPTLIFLINKISSLFVILGEKIKEALGGRDLLGSFIKTAFSIGTAIAEYVIRPIEFVYHTIVSVGKATASVVTASVALFTFLGSTITKVFEELARFGASIAGFVSEDLKDKIQENFVSPLESAKNAQLEVANSAKEATRELVLEAGQEFSEGMNFTVSNTLVEMLNELLIQLPEAENLVSQSMERTKQNIKSSQDSVLSANKAFWVGFYSGFDNGAKSIEQRAKALGTQVQGAIGQGFANGFAAMGAALVNGQNMLEALGAAVLSSFGDILIMLGKEILVVGLLMSKVPFLFGLQGAAAVAVGIGMMIAGGALKAFASNFSQKSKSSAGVGDRASASIGAPSTSVPVVGVGEVGTLGNIPQDEDRRRGATVNITVEGNVFNQKETGLEIARIIRESFESDGVKVFA